MTDNNFFCFKNPHEREETIKSQVINMKMRNIFIRSDDSNFFRWLINHCSKKCFFSLHKSKISKSQKH